MPRNWTFLSGAALLVLSLGCPSSTVAAPTLGQVIDFESGQTQGWSNGGSATDPVNVPTGGRGGFNDNFLQVTAGGGGGPGSHLVTINENSRWTGNFRTAGVTGVTMDLKNFGTAPLQMRIAVIGAGGAPSGPSFVTTTPFTLPADGAWHAARFDLDAAHLSQVQGSASLNTVLDGVTEFRILHSTLRSFRGDVINSSFGVDNITAVPEPSAAALIGAGALLLLRRRHVAA